VQDLGKAFTYMFEDQNWVTKILLGGVFVLLSIILVGIPFVAGYSVEVVQNVMAEKPSPLPEWDHLGDKFMKGLVIAIGIFILYIPAIILSMIGSFLQGRSGAFVAVGCLFSCVTFVYEIALGLILPAIYIKYAERPEFGSIFKFNDFYAMISANIGNYIVVLVLSIVASIIAVFGLIGLCIGVIFTGFWAYLVAAYLYGQLGRIAPRTQDSTI
jgi:hypothetical protein